MDVRSNSSPFVAGLRDWLEAVNRRHPWSHNDHFHGWILRNLPARRLRALDVGCGQGALLERLAAHFAEVDGIDVDDGMVTAATARVAALPRVTVQRLDFDQLPADDGDQFDLVTMVAVLHHLDLDRALARVPALLAPEGRLLVVGLARVQSPTDVLIDCISAVANPIMGLLRHPRPVRRIDGVAGDEPTMPVKDPSTAWAEIIAATRTHLPGATARRRLFFRYTLRWDRPR
jgi:SAM-dependent methyltransferase